MKVKLIIICSALLLLSGCSTKLDNDKSFSLPLNNKINANNEYELDCKSIHYITIDTWLPTKSEYKIRSSKWSEQEVLYVENSIAKFFGAEFIVITDNNKDLIIMRQHLPSWLTELVSIDKQTWLGIDTKTINQWISGKPDTTSYLFSCSQV